MRRPHAVAQEPGHGPRDRSTIGIAREYCMRIGPIRPTVPVPSPSA